MGTIERFRNGVHAKGDCANNKSGYAAIHSSIVYTDLYRLDNNHSISAHVPQSSNQRKKSFLHCDILVYMFLKCILQQRSTGIYILFLPSFVSNTLQEIVSSVSSLSGLSSTVLIVQRLDDQYLVTLNFAASTASHSFHSERDLIAFCSQFRKMDNIVALIHPNVHSIYIDAISIIQPDTWCVPASRTTLYVPCSRNNDFCHYAFPWSRSPTCYGFTIGGGGFRKASSTELMQYLNSFAFYEKMVSSVPIYGSCVDCYTLHQYSQILSVLMKKKRPKHVHTLSQDSIEALEDLKKMMFMPAKEF